MNNIDDTNYNPKIKHKVATFFNYTPKHCIFILTIALTFFCFFQTPSLYRFSSIVSDHKTSNNNDIESKLRISVTFLPLKDLRYTKTALEGHTWFMSSMYDTHEEGEVQYQKFPSNASNDRILCIKGHDNHDGAWNYYALAWPNTLPNNATLLKGLTFVSYNHYNYDNIWHGLSSVFPFVAWHMKNECKKAPTRWVLYHRGELRTKMSLWLSLLLEATFGMPVKIEGFDGFEEDKPVCFEEAVVMRHNEGGMSRQRRMETYDYIRCKSRMFCNLTQVPTKVNEIGLTLFMRKGPRSFKNDSAVVDIFKHECHLFKGCQFIVALSTNLSFCDQVKLMSTTDVLISPHGAQLTNMFLMERNSSVMEFFPKGWLKLAGVGQYVYHWIASWSGMKHQGAYRDPNGDSCPYPEDDRRCMSIFKNGKIGHNKTYFKEWVRKVLNEMKMWKIELENGNKFKYRSTPCNCV
ncbi:uncharacterized protein LOC141600885 [Silene latifolia]|uniref:uncharacterized protein LOC141600885 n=1 Tax=Silene latifolia TaxID=37657 RepID=UPI003D76E1D8